MGSIKADFASQARDLLAKYFNERIELVGGYGKEVSVARDLVLKELLALHQAELERAERQARIKLLEDLLEEQRTAMPIPNFIDLTEQYLDALRKEAK